MSDGDADGWQMRGRTVAVASAKFALQLAAALEAIECDPARALEAVPLRA